MRGPSAGAVSLLIVSVTATFVIYSQHRQYSVSVHEEKIVPYAEDKIIRVPQKPPSAVKGSAPCKTQTVQRLSQPVQPILPKTEAKVLRDISKQLYDSDYTPMKYKQGKTIIYESLYKCRYPSFLKNYTSPCWRSKRAGRVFCAPKVVLVGFHKCGTTDTSKWFHNSKHRYVTTDFFLGELGNMCPIEFMEKKSIMFVSNPQITTFGDCPGCLIHIEVLRLESSSITVHSIFQYLQYVRTDDTRYLVTIRNPTDRFLSHYFYLFKMKKDIPAFTNATNVEEKSYDVLHKLVASTVMTLTACLENYGITDCIISPERNRMHEDSFIAGLLRYSCYSVYIREAFKFVPKELMFFSRMEDYAVHPEKVVPEMLKFVKQDMPEDLGLARQVKNQGVKKKPVNQETVDLLDKFFQPFNDDLAQLLSDDKWKYIRDDS